MDALMGLIALLPWWAGLLLAAVGYVVLHAYAAAPIDTAGMRPGQMAVPIMLKGVAAAMQYVWPIACIVGAATSAWQRHSRKQLLEDTRQRGASHITNGLTWQEFEQLIGEAFRQQGWGVQETGGGGADGGVDLRLTNKDGESWLVQCKQWRAYRVGIEVVRELYGAMAAEGATGGFVVTSGRFTEEAKAFARGRNVKLLEGDAVGALVKKGKGTPVGAALKPAPMPQRVEPLDLSPSCPVCAGVMQRRRASRGLNAGNEFWGCAKFPGCRGVRPMAQRQGR
jgi:restriction system protein